MDNVLGLKIRKIRELKNFGQQYVADKLGISQGSYSELENGRTRIDEKKLAQIAAVLEVAPEVIRHFSDTVMFSNSPQSGYFNTNNNNAEKIQELYERLLKEKDEQIALLKTVLTRYKT